MNPTNRVLVGQINSCAYAMSVVPSQYSGSRVPSVTTAASLLAASRLRLMFVWTANERRHKLKIRVRAVYTATGVLGRRSRLSHP